MILKIEFVGLMPSQLKNGILYISMEYATAIHLCACGCGNKVVTPLSPNDWRLNYDGETISLSPSIGNWNFDCKSHYWIIENNIKWHNNNYHFDNHIQRVTNKLQPPKEKKKNWKYAFWRFFKRN